MPFNWDQDWDRQPENNNGATQAEIINILATAVRLGEGDAGLRQALIDQSNQVTIEKGIHPQGPHIRAFYVGGTWHIGLVGTAAGGRAGYRVGRITQWQED